MDKHRIEPGTRNLFQVLSGTDRSQAAAMTLAPGESTGGPDNRHEASDQWLYVVTGAGKATVGDAQVELAAGDLLLIAAGEAHEIRASEDEALVTVNVYAPPEY